MYLRKNYYKTTVKGKQIIMKRKQKRSQARIHIKNQIDRRVIIRRGFCGW